MWWEKCGRSDGGVSVSVRGSGMLNPNTMGQLITDTKHQRLIRGGVFS